MREAIENARLSRRQFMRTAAAGAAAVSAGALAAPKVARVMVASPQSSAVSPSAAKANPGGPVPVPTNWSQTADVVVVGTGLAGLAAAVAANDAGANVLVLEKMSQALQGGSSKVSGSQFYAPVDTGTLALDIASGVAYLQSTAAGSVEDISIFTAQAQGFYDNLAWVKALGGNLGTSTGGSSFASAPGSATYHTFAIALPGSPVQSNGYPVGSNGDGRIWKVFSAAAASRPITILYQTPAQALIQSPTTGEILGVQALAYGSQILNIKANRGVILACGSIEMNAAMEKQYYPVSPVYTPGCPGNTGDGVRMAQAVGADLWHMNAVFPTLSSFVVPGTNPLTYGVAPVSVRGIAVNKFGNRFNQGTATNGPVGGFANEVNVNVCFDSVTLDWDSVPCWAIFDDTARKKGPIMSTTYTPSPSPGVTGTSSWFVNYSGYTWSSDNSAEVASGWILSATSVSALAALIAADPDNEGKMTGAQLQATITAVNADVVAGSDAQLLAPIANLSAINGPPFYAMKIWPGATNAAPGPRRNIECQIVDLSKNPIPRLYSAGEMGAFWGWETSGGTHLAECMWTGRVAGNNAANENPWS